MNKKTLLIVFAVFMATMSFAQTTYFDLHQYQIEKRCKVTIFSDITKISATLAKILSHYK